MRTSKLLLLMLLLCACSFLSAEDLTPGFYDNAEGKKDAELKTYLKSLIRDHTVIDYGTGIDIYNWAMFNIYNTRKKIQRKTC